LETLILEDSTTVSFCLLDGGAAKAAGGCGGLAKGLDEGSGILEVFFIAI